MNAGATDIARRLQAGLASVVAGNEGPNFAVLVALLAGGHLLLEGVPGTAKTLIVRTLARLLGIGFRRIQFTPDLMPSDIVGTTVFDPAAGTSWPTRSTGRRPKRNRRCSRRWKNVR